MAVRISAASITKAVRLEIARLRTGWQTQTAPVPFSGGERAALLRGGLTLEPASLKEDRALTETVQDYEFILATSRSISEVAAALNAPEEEIVHRLEARTLYGVKVGEEQRLPAFQFEADAPLRSIERVIPHLDSHLHPVEVYRWFTSADPDLILGDESYSPREWLRSGGDATIVCERAASLSYPL